MGTYNTYTAEQEEFLKANAPRMSRKALTECFNSVFHCNKSALAIKSWCNRRGFNSPDDGRFKAGCVTWQKGIKGNEFKKHYTDESFKKILHCHETNKTKRIGDEIVIKGVPWVVVSLDYSKPYHERRKPKRRVVWERAHGEVPKDHCIINLDKNPMNCDIENLYCLPIKYRSLLGKNNWWFEDRELTLSAIRWCELFYAIKENA